MYNTERCCLSAPMTRQSPESSNFRVDNSSRLRSRQRSAAVYWQVQRRMSPSYLRRSRRQKASSPYSFAKSLRSAAGPLPSRSAMSSRIFPSKAASARSAAGTSTADLATTTRSAGGAAGSASAASGGGAGVEPRSEAKALLENSPLPEASGAGCPALAQTATSHALASAAGDCSASSRVGERIKTCGSRSDEITVCSAPRQKTHVLPVPLWDCTITSRPFKIGRTARCCTADGRSKP
mmetsp:Transcript_103511/g.299493  ORF Transcript_103511/g.299493 Transcript_103511/m.299493 type:complete len:238 (-) Transcript_103511:182-895(-)